MRRLLWFLLLLIPSLGHAQAVGPGFVDYVTSAPSGACSQGAHQQNVLGSGEIWTCQSGTWAKASGSGGGSCTTSFICPNPSTDQTITGAHGLILSNVASSFLEKGAVGIGTTAVPFGAGFPSSDLGNISSILDVERNYDSVVGDIPVAVQVGFEWLGTIDKNGGEMAALSAYAATSASSTANVNSAIYGFGSEIDLRGSGTVALAIGSASEIVSFGSGNVTSNQAIQTYTENLGTGIITDNYGIYVDHPVGSGPITNNHGIRITNHGGKGTASGYALRIDDQGTGANDWAINVAGGKNSLGPQATAVGRLSVDNATTLQTTDFALGAGWGSTASTAITLATSKDQASVTTITTGGTGIAANPTYALTFKNGTWTQVPACWAVQTGGNDIIADLTVTARSATAYTFKWNGTPTTAKTYEVTIQCTGT